MELVLKNKYFIKNILLSHFIFLKKKIIFSISFILNLGILFYFTINFLYIFNINDFSIIDMIYSAFILISISFWGLHCVGYIDHFLKSIYIYSKIEDSTLIPKNKIKNPPKVAIFIPVFNENPNIIKKIIIKSEKINYNNFEIFLLNDSDDNNINEKILEFSKDFDINHIHRKDRRGYKAGAINDAIKNIDGNVKYLLVLDVDHCPKNNILNKLIPFLEEDPSLTFIQTPQYFRNEKKDRLAIAYSFQQHIFHKHVCRGLNVNESVFMCGTNMIIRLDHLKEIGGMDETCITEDIATSFMFHSNGYKSLYLDQVCAEGMSPPSLSAYFTQQMRWAYGTIQNLKVVIKSFLNSPQSLKPKQWWEYLILNGSWYFLGWTLLLFLTYPIMVLIFGVQPLILGSINPLFLIFISMMGSQFFTSTLERSYRIRDLFLAQGLFFCLFPIYIQASVYALIGKKMDFKVTQKERTKAISFVQLFPQFIIVVLLVIAIVVGVWRLTTGDFINPHFYMIIFWAIYSTTILLFTFIFYLEDIKKGAEFGR